MLMLRCIVRRSMAKLMEVEICLVRISLSHVRHDASARELIWQAAISLLCCSQWKDYPPRVVASPLHSAYRAPERLHLPSASTPKASQIRRPSRGQAPGFFLSGLFLPEDKDSLIQTTDSHQPMSNHQHLYVLQSRPKDMLYGLIGRMVEIGGGFIHDQE